MPRGADPNDFITRAEMERIIAEQWHILFKLLDRRRAERDKVLTAKEAAIVWACAKAWLPDAAAHVGRSITCIKALGKSTEDERVAKALAELVEALVLLRPTNEDTSQAVVRLPLAH